MGFFPFLKFVEQNHWEWDMFVLCVTHFQVIKLEGLNILCKGREQRTETKVMRLYISRL